MMRVLLLLLLLMVMVTMTSLLPVLSISAMMQRRCGCSHSRCCRCGVCGCGIVGQDGAVKHAKDTGHINFQEYK
jgi:hypothetical protein